MRHVLAIATALLLTATVARAAIKTETVEYKAGDTTLKGFLAYDDATTDKRPAVIIVHEWWGMTEYPKRRAQDVAKLGYVAFVADMFGEGKMTKDPKEAGAWAGAVKGDVNLLRTRAQAAMDVVTKHKLVDATRIGAMGYCFGGTVALEMARAGMPVVGVVSFHGALGTKNPAEAGKFKAKVLACHGADDNFVPVEEVHGFVKEMQDAKADWSLVAYGNAVHSFTNPDADKFGIPGVAYNEKADKRSWEAMKDFFNEVLGAPAGGKAHAAAKASMRLYYVAGDVAAAGAYNLAGAPISITDAVIAARPTKGKTEDVRVTLIRMVDDKQQISEFELGKLLKDKASDVTLAPGDQIIVGAKT